MANAFSKEERVAFEEILKAFEDQLVLSRNVDVYNTDQVMMERTDNVIWRPMPYIATSEDGTPGTPVTFNDNTQLTVPSQISLFKTSTWNLTALQLRDALQRNYLGKSARQKLSSDINVAILGVASSQATLVVKRTTAAGTFDDVAACDTIMNEQGVPSEDRYMVLSSTSYNGMAGNLAVASRSFGNKKSDDAYERAYVGNVSNFETFKLDYANRVTAAAGVATINTTGVGSFYTPLATTTSTNGLVKINVDNRYQLVTVTATAGVVAGDAFTIAGIEAAHHITKTSTGKLKTFRVIAVNSGTTMTISPPIIAPQAGIRSTLQYQNVVVASQSATAAITFLNTAAADINVFWQKESLEILPGRLALEENAGVSIMRGTTEQGFELVMQKFQQISTNTAQYRMDIAFGVVNLNPEMNGILLFNQV